MMKFLGDLLVKLGFFKFGKRTSAFASLWIFGEIEKPDRLK